MTTLAALALITGVVLARVSAGPTNHEARSSISTTGSPETILDAIDRLDTNLAKAIKDIDFFDSSTLNPVNWPLDFQRYNEETKVLILSASYSSPIAVIASFLTMNSIHVEIRIKVVRGDIQNPDKSLKLSLRRYVVSGSWTVGGTAIDLSVTKDNDQLEIIGSPQPTTVSIDSFLGALGAGRFLPEAVLSVSPDLSKFSLQQTSIVVIYSKSFGYALSLSGYPTISGWGSASMQMVLQRNTGSLNNIYVMTVQFPSLSLASLVSQLSGIDISGIPVIGSLTLSNSVLTISTDNPSQLLLENANVQKGVTLDTSFSLGSGMASLAYSIRLYEGNVTFEKSGDVANSMTVGQLLAVLVPQFDSSSITLPAGIPDVFNIEFKDYYYDSDTKSVGVTVELADSVTLIPGFVTASNPYVTVTATLTSPRKVSVSGDADWTLGNTDFAITIEEVDGGNGYVVRGEGEALKVGKILTQFGATLLPAELSSVLKSSGLSSFKILTPRVQIPLGTASNDFVLFLAGQPVIAGWSGVTLNAAIADKGSTGTAMATGFEFVDTNFAGVIKSLTGVSVSFISLLDQSLQMAVVISPITMNDVTLTGTLLSQLQVKKGVSVIGVFSFPDNCKGGDLLCEFAKSAMGADASLQLRSTIASATDFLIAAAASDISLGKGLTLSEAALEFQIGTETSAGVSGTLKLNSPDLTFIGAVRVGVRGLQLSLQMVGIWENAFSINWLAFGNGIISMDVIPGVPLPGLELGAEVRIGSKRGKELIGQAYVGFSPVFPDKNYYYASINKASIQAILDAFGMSVSIPRPLTESGFPNGLSSSFSLAEQEPVPGVIIPAGYKLNGTINILGYEMSADISLNPPTEFTIDMDMGPLNLAEGLFKLYRSRNEANKGPRFYANVKTSTAPPSVILKAEGYARILNMVETAASLEITNTQYVMTVSGPFFGFTATLKVYASYGSLKSAAFQVNGVLSSEWKEKVADTVKQVIKSGADKATKAIGDAKKDVEKAQKKFDDASEALNSAKDDVKNMCKLKSCGTSKP